MTLTAAITKQKAGAFLCFYGYWAAVGGLLAKQPANIPLTAGWHCTYFQVFVIFSANATSHSQINITQLENTNAN